MTSDEAKGYAYLAGAVALAWFAYKAVSKASDAAGAVGDAVSSAASSINEGVSVGIGAIGSLFDLPTPDQTIDDPYVVRYIIDTQGSFEASKQGTAWAYLKALAMDKGSGHPPQSSVSKDVVQRVASGPIFWPVSVTVPTDDVLSGPSWNDMKNQTSSLP